MNEDKNILSNKRILNISEAAEYAEVSRGTIENWLSTGVLPYESLPSRGAGSHKFRRIRFKDLENFLNAHYRDGNSTQSLTVENKNTLILLPKNNKIKHPSLK